MLCLECRQFFAQVGREKVCSTECKRARNTALHQRRRAVLKVVTAQPDLTILPEGRAS